MSKKRIYRQWWGEIDREGRDIEKDEIQSQRQIDRKKRYIQCETKVESTIEMFRQLGIEIRRQSNREKKRVQMREKEIGQMRARKGLRY